LLPVAQLYEELPFKRQQVNDQVILLKAIKTGLIRQAICDFLLAVCNNNFSVLHHFHFNRERVVGSYPTRISAVSSVSKNQGP